MSVATEIIKIAHFTVPYEPKISNKFDLQSKTLFALGRGGGMLDIHSPPWVQWHKVLF